MAREKGMGNLQQERSGRWTMRVGIDGKRYSRSTRTKDRAKAERFLQRFLAQFGLGEHRLPLADVWLEYLKSPRRNELAQSTLESKRKVWLQFAKWMEHSYLYVDDLAGITADMIAEYLACIRTEVCATTYNSRVCVLREIFHALSDKAGLDFDPWEGVRFRPDDCHSRRELTLDEIKRLLDAARRVGNPQSPIPNPQSPSSEWHTLFLIGIYTGLRLGDCCRLDWSCVNFAQGVIQLVPAKTKRHHQRLVTIPIHQKLGAELLASQVKVEGVGVQRNLSSCSAGLPEKEANHHCTTTPPDHNYTTPTPSTYTSFSGPVLPMIADLYRRGSWRVYHVLTKIFKMANIDTAVRVEGRRHRAPEATFHSLRHTFVSFAANAGVPLHIVQAIVGHGSTAMTRHYYHENLTALKSAVAAIPTL